MTGKYNNFDLPNSQNMWKSRFRVEVGWIVIGALKRESQSDDGHTEMCGKGLE